MQTHLSWSRDRRTIGVDQTDIYAQMDRDAGRQRTDYDDHQVD